MFCVAPARRLNSVTTVVLVARSLAITAILFICQAFVCHELMHMHFYKCFWKDGHVRNGGK